MTNVLNTRAARRELIVEIIRSGAVGSQSDLVELLRERGIEVTQATVSRDLDEIGAVKTIAADGRSLYAVPAEGGEDRLQADELEDINARLIRVAEDTMVSIAHSGNLVVLRTPPGAAQYLASAFDHSHLTDVIGTIAGDDTIMLVVAESSTGQAVADRLQQLIKNRR
ncbi:MAG: arginine repressor [Candidatus Nanopelagicales bacterium]|jgi:transcriptional regulator of arginine metabolism|nr:arginine repressor [Candidatus Nanopelagicales bacterium]